MPSTIPPASDCSDHEVNIKILLGAEVQQGRLALAERNELLKEMTDNVAALVLRDNYLQTQILAMNQLNPHAFLHAHADLIMFLREHAGLSRKTRISPQRCRNQAARPSAARASQYPEVGMCSPTAKSIARSELFASDLPDDADFSDRAHPIFPQRPATALCRLNGQPLPQARNHGQPLANRVVNRMGISFVQRFSAEMDRPAWPMWCAPIG